jgi:hypothetical protein
VESNVGKRAPGRVGARGRRRGFGRLDPHGGMESGKGGARRLLHRGRGKAGTGFRRVHAGRGRRRGRSGAAQRRVERRRHGGGGLVAGTMRDRCRWAPVGDM